MSPDANENDPDNTQKRHMTEYTAMLKILSVGMTMLYSGHVPEPDLVEEQPSFQLQLKRDSGRVCRVRR